jgi:arylsulfatase A
MLLNRKPTAGSNPSFLLDHLLHRITTLIIVALSLSQSICQVFAEYSANKPCRPNIVLILADDYGYGSAGCYGADPKLVRTPSLDRLAKEGRRFTDANTTSSVCSPTRYSVLTGRYCWRTSLTHEVLGSFAPLHIEPGRMNMASLLRKHGYATAAVGKWHLGYGTANDSPKWRTDYTGELSPGPLEIGFDYHFGVPSNHGDLTGVYVENHFAYGLRSGSIPPGSKIAHPASDDDHFQTSYGLEDTEGGRGRILEIDAPRRKNDAVMATLTDKAVDWITQQPKDRPFFLYFTPVAVHNPITPAKDLAGKSAAGLYGDWIHELDRSVARILDLLDKQGIADNTLVIFSSDNGGVFRPQKVDSPKTKAFQAGLQVNGSLRGGKHDVWEGGFKVPLLVRWPGRAPAGTVCDQMISLADILATTAAIVEEPLPPVTQGAEDSRSFLAAIGGDSAAPIREDMIVHSADGVFAVRKGRWKWIEGVPVDDIQPAVRKGRAEQFRSQLYDTTSDPGETKDVSAEHLEVVQELSSLLERYRDGGYSRALPPAGTRPKRIIDELPAPAGEIVLSEALTSAPKAPWRIARGEWSPRAGGWWGAQKSGDEQGASLFVPLKLADGTIQYQISFHGANRHSLRIECANGKHGFRVEVARSYVALTKNPSRGEDKEQTDPLARRPLKLEADVWYPVRITLRGTEATVQVNDVVIQGSHAVIGEPKTGANILVFGASAGFRNFTAAK